MTAGSRCRAEEDAQAAASARQQGQPHRDKRQEQHDRQRPRLAPRIEPASMTPMDCAVIGTGMKPTGIGGISPSAAMMAANRAMWTISRVVSISVKSGFFEEFYLGRRGFGLCRGKTQSGS